MKKLLVFVMAFAIGATSFAEETSVQESENSAPAAEGEGEEAAPVEEEEESSILSGGVNFDFFSAYVYRGNVICDRPVFEPYVWLDFDIGTAFDLDVESLYLDVNIWQNYNLCNRQRDVMRGEWNETDYEIALWWTAFSTEEGYELRLALGNHWFTYMVREMYEKDYASTCEVFLRAEFDTPFVGIYGVASESYRYFNGFSGELGLTKDYALTDEITIGAIFSTYFGSANYLSYLFGGQGRDYNAEEDYFEKRFKAGLSAATLLTYISWTPMDWLELRATLAYTSVLNDDIREAYRDSGWYGNYKDDLVWGGFSACVSF